MASSKPALKGSASVPLRSVPMRVIVCGVHRTGTMSMRAALMQLGFNDTYHMHSVMNNLDTHPQQWKAAFEGKYTDKREPFTKAEWDRLLGNAQACCDLPSAVFSCELAEMYPEAKVVILNRDPEKWYNSVLNTIYKNMKPSGPIDVVRKGYIVAFDPLMRSWVSFAMTMFRTALNYDHGKEKDKALAWFDAQYTDFRARIPADRRIEFTVQDGWGPLCEHLGVPVPMIKDEETGKMVVAPFPHVNDAVHFKESTMEFDRLASARATKNMFSIIGKAAVTGAVGYGSYLMWKTRLGGRF